MSCLSERELLQLVADGGRVHDRAHHAACDRCDARYRAAMNDLDLVRNVLLHSEQPRSSPSLLARYWLPASAMAVAALALLVWAEMAVWRAVTPAQPEEVTAFLSDVSATMFSTRDALAASDDVTADDGLAAGCPSDALGILGCEGDNENGPSLTRTPRRRP